MRIEEIKIRNFRSYGENTTTIPFSPRLNVLLARTGSGKSSVLEAILIALFGFSRAGLKKNDVLRRTVTPDRFQVELTFFYEGTHFKVARGNDTRLETSPDGLSWTTVSENSNEINDFLEKTLGVSSAKFKDLFYSAQGQLTKVVTGSPEERQQSIDKLLGAEGLRLTYAHLSEFSKFYDHDIGEATGGLARANAYLERRDFDRFRDDKREAERKIIETGDQIESIKRESSSLDAELQGILAKARPLEEANGRVQKILRRLSERESELKNREFQIRELEGKTSNLEERAKENREKLTRLGPEREKAEKLLK
jgi:exonuclease SbcC